MYFSKNMQYPIKWWLNFWKICTSVNPSYIFFFLTTRIIYRYIAKICLKVHRDTRIWRKKKIQSFWLHNKFSFLLFKNCNNRCSPRHKKTHPLVIYKILRGVRKKNGNGILSTHVLNIRTSDSKKHKRSKECMHILVYKKLS